MNRGVSRLPSPADAPPFHNKDVDNFLCANLSDNSAHSVIRCDGHGILSDGAVSIGSFELNRWLASGYNSHYDEVGFAILDALRSDLQRCRACNFHAIAQSVVGDYNGHPRRLRRGDMRMPDNLPAILRLELHCLKFCIFNNEIV